MANFDNIEYSVIPYDQGEIEKVLKQMMFDKGITDVLYEGSNVSQLSSVISYVIATLNTNTAINLQETLLPLATKRMNILFGARQLGYEATSKKSYRYNLTLRATLNPNYYTVDANGNKTTNPYSDVQFDLELKHNTKFICGAYSYYYTGPTIVNFWSKISNADITYLENTSPDTPGYQDVYDKVYKNIEVIEGSLFTYETEPTLSMTATDYQDANGDIQIKQDYLIPFKDVEEDSLNVYLTYVDANGEIHEKEPRFKTSSFLIDENMTQQQNLFARVQNIILGFPSIFFQMGGFGNPVRKGTLIEVELLTSNGAQGEAIGRFRADAQGFTLPFEVFEYSLVSKGQDEESNDNIKENAIVYHNTANRAVTKYDYEAITKRHQILSDAAAWGGEEESPKEKGHIWVSGIPATKKRVVKFRKDLNISHYEIKIGEPNRYPAAAPFEDYPNLSDWFLTEDLYSNNQLIQGQQTEIINYLDAYKMMTTEVHYRHPLYVDFDIDCDIVKYDVTKSAETINSDVFQVISDYFQNYIEKFNSEYINSNLQRVIDRYLGLNSGITYNIKVQGSLCREMVDKFNLNLDKLETYECPNRTPRTVIKCTLAFPFESLYDTTSAVSTLKTQLLPRIDTKLFDLNNDLTVDYNGFPTGPNVNTDYMTTRMYLGGVDFGEYAVNRKTSTIDLTFEFQETGITSLDSVFGPPLADPVTGDLYYRDVLYRYFDIKYPLSVETSTNIPFTKNTIPRLRNVTFIDN